MDCSTFRNFSVARERLCKSHQTPSGKVKCDECELDELRKYSERRYCGHRCFECPDKAILIVQKWIDKFPIKTRKSEFYKIFPRAYKDIDGLPTVCAGDIFGFDCVEGEKSACKKCWNTPIEE